VEVLGVEAKIVGVDSGKMIEVDSETVGALEEGTGVDSEEEEAVVEDEVATDIGVMSKKMKAQRSKRCRRAQASIRAHRL
jgi:hypothetical protein